MKSQTTVVLCALVACMWAATNTDASAQARGVVAGSRLEEVCGAGRAARTEPADVVIAARELFADQVKLVHVIRGLLGVMFFAGLALSFINVIMRFVFLEPIQWAEESLAHWLVWSVCIGSFLVTLERQHLSMDLLVNRMPGRIRTMLLGLGSLAIAGVAVLMVVESASVLKLMLQFDQRTMAAGIPMAIPYSGVALGFALMVVALLIPRPPKP